MVHREVLKTGFCILVMVILALLNYSLNYRHDLYIAEVHFNTARYTYTYTGNHVTDSQYESSVLYHKDQGPTESSAENVKSLSSATENRTVPSSDIESFTPTESSAENVTKKSLSSATTDHKSPYSTQSTTALSPETSTGSIALNNNVRVIMIPKGTSDNSAARLKASSSDNSAAGLKASSSDNSAAGLKASSSDNSAAGLKASSSDNSAGLTYRSTTSQIPPHSTTLPPTNSLPRKTGYVLVMKIYEQQTMASGNLLQLQCWASSLNLNVVKPFMYTSNLMTPLNEAQHASMLKLDDVFDMGDWSEHAKQEGYSPLVDWDDFIKYAPRKVVYAEFKYTLLSTVKSIRASGRPFPHPPEGIQYKTGCKFNAIFEQNSRQFLSSKGFKIVRKVCFNFQNGDEMTLEQFNAHLLGIYASSDVTVIINKWRGLGESQRVLIREQTCTEKVPYREQVKPSQALIRNAEKYAMEYLNDDGYLAVIARFEMTAITRYSHSSESDPYGVIPFCTELTLGQWNTMKKDTGLNTTFLSIDIGKYGSDSFESHNYYGHLKDMVMFLTQVYDRKMGVQEWEKTFESVSHSMDSGYIAMLQKVIVTRAKCILFVGGGSFQRHTLHLYQQLHPDPAEQCVTVVRKCTSVYRPVE